jgi:hypothetical protein
MVNTQHKHQESVSSHSNLRTLQEGLWISTESKFKVNVLRRGTANKVSNIIDFPTSNIQSQRISAFKKWVGDNIDNILS